MSYYYLFKEENLTEDQKQRLYDLTMELGPRNDVCYRDHIAEIKAEVAEVAYYNGFKDALVIEPPLPPATGTSSTIDIFAYRVEQASRCAASQYAIKSLQGEEK